MEKVKKPVALFVDCLAGYINCIELCNEHGIILYGLFSHASHRIQPLGLTQLPSMRIACSTSVKNAESAGESVSVSSFAKLLKSVWESCSGRDLVLRGFKLSGISPFNPSIPLTGGKKGTVTSCGSSPALISETAKAASELAASSPSQCVIASTSVSVALPIPAMHTSRDLPTSKLDNLSSLLRLSHKVGMKKSERFLKLIRYNKSSAKEDKTFLVFKSAVNAICSDAKLNSEDTSKAIQQNSDSKGTSSTPQALPDSKSGKSDQSFNKVLSPETLQMFLKRKQEVAMEIQERKKRKKEEKEQTKERRLKDKQENEEKKRRKRKKLMTEERRNAETEKMLSKEEGLQVHEDDTNEIEMRRIQVCSDKEDVEVNTRPSNFC